MLVGEVGISRDEFLYTLRLWEIQAIIDGYRMRSRSQWESARMNAFFVMSAMADLKKNGIRSSEDLIRFPWEREMSGSERQPTLDEQEQLREIMRRENAEAERREKESGGT